MREFILMHRGLLNNGIDALGDDIHSGIGSQIPFFQIAYSAEKLNCIYSGMLEVKAKEIK